MSDAKLLNGTAVSPGPEVGGNPPQMTPVQIAEAVLNATRPVIGTMMSGFLATCGNVPPHVVLNAIAYNVGAFMGQSITADLKTQMELRKGFRDAFEGGIKAQQMRMPAAPPTPGDATGDALARILRKGN